MAMPRFLKKKSTYIILVLVAIVGYWLWARNAKNAKPTYETFAVERTTLRDTVDVTGEIKPVARINLSFERAGQVGQIAVKVGDKVKKGDVLAALNAKDVTYAYDSASASLAAAEAQLNLALAGAKNQNVRISEAGVTQAKANLEKAKTDLANAKISTANSVTAAELAVTTASNTFENQTKQLDQSVVDAYVNARAAYLNALGPLQTALTDGDRVSGVDDQVTNASYKYQLGAATAGAMDRAKASYALAKAARTNAETLVHLLTTSSSHVEIDAAGDAVVNATTLVQQFVNDVTTVLAGTISGSSLSATNLDAIRTVNQTDRAAIATQMTTVLGVRQGTTSAVLTHDDSTSKLSDALETAKLNFDTAKSQAETTLSSGEVLVRVQEAALAAAEAQLDLTNATPRNVDLDPLRAAVAQARAAYDKAAADKRDAEIVAPVDGVVSAINPQTDERVSPNQTVITMLSGSTYDIEVLLPEADVASIRTSQHASTTLDAYGDNLEFPGVVESIEPDQTLVQDAVYYKSRVSIEADGHEVKPGMTANTTILVAEASDALIIPSRAVSTNAKGETMVKILAADGSTRDAQVKLGMKGDEGRVVVTEGVKEGDVIIVSQ